MPVEEGEIMGSSQGTADYIREQAAGAGVVSTRRMFGEFALYVDGKVAAFICDDQLLLKRTEAGRALLARETGQEAPATGAPYPGAKPYYLVAGELWDDADFLARLLRETARELPTKPARRARKGKA